MAKLTEDMVVARTRASDLSAIRKLNCWGGGLQDISLLRRMSNVEVLSLSVNKISSLADIQYCKNLRELYVRKNEIKKLNEICYLKNLPYLKALWLGENPCSASDGLYRMTVIKNLPTLEKLDDIKIEREERQDSLRKGRELIHPEDSDYENNSPIQSPVRGSRSSPASGRSSDQECDDSESRKSYSPDYEQPTYSTPTESKHSQGNERQENKNYSNTVRRPSETSYERHYDNGMGNDSVASEKQNDSQCTTYLNRCNSDTSIVAKKEKTLTEPNTRITSKSVNQEDFEGDCGGAAETKQQEKAYRQYDNYRIEGDRYSKISPYPPRRPVTRNSNLLSAVLCLIKELDYPSLEVVAIAVRCRMDEFDD